MEIKVDEEQIYDNGHPKLEGRDLPPEVVAERRQMEEGCQEAQDEEGLRPTVIKDEHGPTEQEIDEHMITHIPFRSWCPFCVMGKACNSDHRRIKEPHGSVPVISIDYGYMGEGGDEDKM